MVNERETCQVPGRYFHAELHPDPPSWLVTHNYPNAPWRRVHLWLFSSLVWFGLVSAVLGVEARTSHVVAKYSAIEVCPQPSVPSGQFLMSSSLPLDLLLLIVQNFRHWVTSQWPFCRVTSLELPSRTLFWLVLCHNHIHLPLKSFLVSLPLEEGWFFLLLWIPFLIGLPDYFKVRHIHFFYMWSQLADLIYKTSPENSMGAPTVTQTRLFADSDRWVSLKLGWEKESRKTEAQTNGNLFALH